MSDSKSARPNVLNLAQQRKRAKELVRAHRQRAEPSAERLRRHLPRAARLSDDEVFALDFRLSEAQLVVAREAGFGSWPQLKRASEQQGGSAEERLAVALRAALAGSPLEPGLAIGVHLAAALADAGGLRRLVEEEPARATASTAEGLTPLLCVCCSRHGRGNAGVLAARLEIASRLLDLGADPNQPFADARAQTGWRWPIEGAAEEVGSPELVELLLARGASVTIPSALVGKVSDPQPVKAAVRGGHRDCLTRVLAAGAAGWDARDALEVAVEHDQPELVKLLLAHGAFPNEAGRVFGHHGGILHSALMLGRSSSMLTLLLDGGASVKARDRDGRTPLAVAVRTAQHQAIELLERRSADPAELGAVDRALGAAVAGEKVPSTGGLDFKRTDHQMLCWAIRNGREASVASLLSLGLDPNVPDDNGETALDLALASGGSLLAEALRAAGAAPSEEPPVAERLFELAADAVVQGDADGLGELLDEEPELVRARSRRAHRATLLHYVAANGVEQERQRTPANIASIAELLLARGAEVDALANTYGGGPGQTPLGLSVTSIFPEQAGVMAELVIALVRAGANPNGIDDEGGPLQGAIGEGRRSAIGALIRAGARVDRLHFAAAAGDLVRLRELFAAASKDQRGRAVIAAANFDHPPALELLTELGADLSYTDNQGFTALHWAAFYGRLGQLRFLLQRGVSPELRNAYGGTVLGTALWASANARLEVDHAPVVEALLEAGADVRAGGGPWGDPRLDALLKRYGASF